MVSTAHYRLLLLLGLWLLAPALPAAESWQTALARMPLVQPVQELNRTNCVDVMLWSLQSNRVVKAVIFMPGATDEFYFFRRAKATLTNAAPSLLDAVNALTNQTLIRATFRPPMLLLHADDDFLEPEVRVEDKATARRLKRAAFVPRVVYNDRDWDFVQPILQERLAVTMLPGQYVMDSWHFYRHSFAGWNLTGWEALEAIARAGRTRFTVRKQAVLFEGDERQTPSGKP